MYWSKYLSEIKFKIEVLHLSCHFFFMFMIRIFGWMIKGDIVRSFGQTKCPSARDGTADQCVAADFRWTGDNPTKV